MFNKSRLLILQALFQVRDIGTKSSSGTFWRGAGLCPQQLKQNLSPEHSDPQSEGQLETHTCYVPSYLPQKFQDKGLFNDSS